MKVRAKAVSLATASNWTFNFALAWAVPPGLSTIAWKTYFIFATFNFAACIHVFFCFPETAQRTLEEIEDVFAQGHVFRAWKVDRDVGRKTVEEVIQSNKVFVSLSLFLPLYRVVFVSLADFRMAECWCSPPL